jgi:hypothetical protein
MLRNGKGYNLLSIEECVYVNAYRVYACVCVCVCSYHYGLRTSVNDSAADEFRNS